MYMHAYINRNRNRQAQKGKKKRQVRKRVVRIKSIASKPMSKVEYEAVKKKKKEQDPYAKNVVEKLRHSMILSPLIWKIL